MEVLSITGLVVFVTGLVAGAIAALKVIAPRTKNVVDDKVLEVLEKVEPHLPKA